MRRSPQPCLTLGALLALGSVGLPGLAQQPPDLPPQTDDPGIPAGRAPGIGLPGAPQAGPPQPRNAPGRSGRRPQPDQPGNRFQGDDTGQGYPRGPQQTGANPFAPPFGPMIAPTPE